VAELVNPRRYDSTRRRAAAADRRHQIVRTAAESFLANGYAQTTMAEIARRSAVSNDLVFRLFGNKRGVLKEVMDYVIGGDDQDIAMLERDGPQAIRHCSDQREQVRLFSAGITEQLCRIGPYQALLQTAAAVEPEIAGLRDDLNTGQRRHAMTTVAEWLSGNGPLKDAMTVDHAAAIIWTLTSSEVYAMLTRDWRWTDDEYRRWLADTLETTLLPRESTSAARS
jgi:AcrR family transcriptional regulator